MSHSHMGYRWLMARTTDGATYIVVVGVVISVLRIISTFLLDGYHLVLEQITNQNRVRANSPWWMSKTETCPTNLLSNSIRDAISDSDCSPVTRSSIALETMSVSNPAAIPITIPESDCNCSHCTQQLSDAGLHQWVCETAGKHFCSRYIA